MGPTAKRPQEPSIEHDAAERRLDRPIARRSLIGLGVAGAMLLGNDPAWAMRRPMPVRDIHLVNSHTGECFRDAYWAKGRYLPGAFKRIDWLMRDFHIGRAKPIDPRLIDLLFVLHARC